MDKKGRLAQTEILILPFVSESMTNGAKQIKWRKSCTTVLTSTFHQPNVCKFETVLFFSQHLPILRKHVQRPAAVQIVLAGGPGVVLWQHRTHSARGLTVVFHLFDGGAIAGVLGVADVSVVRTHRRRRIRRQRGSGRGRRCHVGHALMGPVGPRVRLVAAALDRLPYEAVRAAVLVRALTSHQAAGVVPGQVRGQLRRRVVEHVTREACSHPGAGRHAGGVRGGGQRVAQVAPHGFRRGGETRGSGRRGVLRRQPVHVVLVRVQDAGRRRRRPRQLGDPGQQVYHTVQLLLTGKVSIRLTS